MMRGPGQCPNRLVQTDSHRPEAKKEAKAGRILGCYFHVYYDRDHRAQRETLLLPEKEPVINPRLRMAEPDLPE
jgi:hypothetical protein